MNGTPAHALTNIKKTFSSGDPRRSEAQEEVQLPSLISNPSSIRRDPDGNLVESCLTPRSRLLRDMVANELRAEVFRQHNTQATPDAADNIGDAPVFLTMSLPEILVQHEKSRKKKDGGRSGGEVQLAVFHQVMVLLLRDSVCWNRLIAVEALSIERVKSFATTLGTDLPSSMAECLKDKFPPVKRFAIEAVRQLAVQGELEAATGAAHLRSTALNDQDWRLRAEAARALCHLGEDAISELISILEDSTFWPVRGEAALALGSMCVWKESKTNVSEALSFAASSALAVALKDRIEGVREAAATALGTMGAHASNCVQPLIMTTRDDDLRVRIAAVRALGKIISQAAPRQVYLRYELLMTKGNLENIGLKGSIGFSDSLRLTCRALTRTLRDQEPLFQLALLASEMEDQEAENFKSPRSSMMAFMVSQRKKGELDSRRAHVKELFHAAEVSLRQIGAYAGPNMVARLIDEDESHSGFGNRMSLLRGLTCSRNGFESDDMVCAILSEWISAPVLGNKQYSQSLTAVANSLPVSGLHLDTFTQDATETLRYAVLHGDEGDVFIAFAVMNQLEAAHNMLTRENIESQTVSVQAHGGGTRPVYVHTGMWTTLDGIWGDVCRSLQHAVTEGTNLRRLVLCGSGMGAGIAKVATLRLHVEEKPLGDVRLPEPDLDEGEKPTGILCNAFGGPNVITSMGDEPPLDLMYCSKTCSQYKLPGDLLPLMLSNDSALHVLEKAMRRPTMMGCCHRRQSHASAAVKKASSYKGLFNSETLTPSPRDKRSRSIYGLDVSAKCYTNSMCWLMLTQKMKP